MAKTTFFTGQPIFNQLLNLIPKSTVAALSKRYKTDHYYKTFKTFDHLVTMLYCSFFRCNSLRELCTGLQACEHRLQHMGIRRAPKRSTVAEANSKRSEQFFASLYHELYRQYYPDCPDSRSKNGLEDRLFIIDSTTIKLFSNIMKGAGSKPQSGRQKGGAKAHVMMKSDEDVPAFIHITHASRNDRLILPFVRLPEGSTVVFDSGYNNYKQFEAWTSQKVTWVTRMVETAWVEELLSATIDEAQMRAGIISDQRVRLGRPSNKPTPKIEVRKIVFYDQTTKRIFTFITNNFELDALAVAGIYKKRWKIELLFKRFKQHCPLRYFLGENENAIRIQIWCAFIADLLIKIIKDKVKARKWSFANIAGMIRQHLMTYINIFSFLNNPDKALLETKAKNNQLRLSFSG